MDRIKKFFNYLKTAVKNHKLALVGALLVGLIYIAPNIIFIVSLGNDYKGIPIMQTANEDFYLARIQEILDGHLGVGSQVFFEYKDQMPLSPPTGEFFYAIPSFIFNISPVNILIASRFFLPFILFLLIYFLICQLTRNKEFLSNPEGSRQGGTYGARINAIAGAIFITLGYDLIDFRTIFGYLKGGVPPGDFLIWSRPVNPILGAIFLISFLTFLWNIMQKDAKRQKLYIIGASVFLALMITSYFFSWGMAISITGVLILIYLLKKEYKAVKNLIIVVIFGFLLSAPYWYNSWRASQSSWYHDSALRNGLFYTHYPLFNKLMLMTLGVYLFCIFLPILISRLRGEKNIIHFENWHWFCLSFILGSLWAYSQQIITGMTIWPYHFVQYSIPLAIIVSMALFYNVIRKKSQFLWKAGIFIIIFTSFIFGVYTQASTYGRFYSYYSDIQSHAELFNWINRQEKDCVILVYSQTKKNYYLNGFIPAFTHCNIYNSNWSFSMMPIERIYHNYFTYIFFNGATSQNINEYLKNNKTEALGYLFSNWREMYNAKDFPDVYGQIEEKLKDIPRDYKKFISGDIRAKLGKYRLDYILIKGKPVGKIADLIKELKPVYVLGDISVFKF